MLNLFRKRNSIKRQSNSNPAENRLDNPSYLFSQCGPALNTLWREFVKGENTSVTQYQKYTDFLSSNLSSILMDSLKRPMLPVFDDSGSKKIFLTRGQIAYLNTFDFNKDVFISDQVGSEIYRLKLEQLELAKNELTSDELAFCSKVVDYFRDNIIPKVNEVARRRTGFDICEYNLPLNTIECVKYHMYISHENYDFSGGELSKWNYIFSAPIYEHRSNRDNPIVPVQIDNMSAFILDCLCYSYIALPTLDILRVINCRGENGSVKESLEHYFGTGVVNFMKRCIVQYNCANFREWVSLGLMTK